MHRVAQLPAGCRLVDVGLVDVIGYLHSRFVQVNTHRFAQANIHRVAQLPAGCCVVEVGLVDVIGYLHTHQVCTG